MAVSVGTDKQYCFWGEKMPPASLLHATFPSHHPKSSTTICGTSTKECHLWAGMTHTAQQVNTSAVSTCIIIVVSLFFNVYYHYYLLFFSHSRTLKRCCVINDEQQGLESELRMVALNPQLAISLASINISFYCVYGSNSRGGEGRCYIFPLTCEYTWMHSGGTLIADSVYACDHWT